MKLLITALLGLLASNAHAENTCVVVPFFGDDIKSCGAVYGIYDSTNTPIGPYYTGASSAVVLTAGGSGSRAGDLYELRLREQKVTGGNVYYTGANCTGTPFDAWLEPDNLSVMEGAHIGVDPSAGPWTMDTPITDLKIFLFKKPISASALAGSLSYFGLGDGGTGSHACRNLYNVGAGEYIELEMVSDPPSIAFPLTVKAN